jgi:hypothetical protein
MGLDIAVNTITGVTLTEESSLTTNPRIVTTVRKKAGSIRKMPHDSKTVGFSQSEY